MKTLRRLRCPTCAALAVLIFAPIASGSVVIRDLRYESPGSRDNRLDLYLPDDRNPDKPTILYIHGGGWAGGDKSAQAALHREMADAGYAVVSCNYTLSAHVQPSYPQVMYDVKAVVRWIRTTGVDAHGISPIIITTGASAGGHLALMLAVTDGVEMFEPLSPPPGGYRIDAVISTFGPTDLVELAKRAGGNSPIFVNLFGAPLNEQSRHLYEAFSPITYIDRNIPPTGYFQGTRDPLVPIAQIRRFDDEMDVRSRVSLLFVYEGAHEIVSLGGDPGVAARLKRLIPPLLENDGTRNAPMYVAGLTRGSLLDGVIDDLYFSDDEHVAAQSEFGFTIDEANIVELATAHHADDDSRAVIDATIELRLDDPGGTLDVALLRIGAGVYDTVGRFGVGLTEQVHTVRDIDAGPYMNPTTGIFVLRSRQVVIATWVVTGFRSYHDVIESRAR